MLATAIFPMVSLLTENSWREMDGDTGEKKPEAVMAHTVRWEASLSLHYVTYMNRKQSRR